MSDTLLTVIGQQTVEISELKAQVEDLSSRINKAVMHMICIGGPLNDNKLQFNKEQLRLIRQIHSALED
jgi:hypothetical protein